MVAGRAHGADLTWARPAVFGGAESKVAQYCSARTCRMDLPNGRRAATGSAADRQHSADGSPWSSMLPKVALDDRREIGARSSAVSFVQLDDSGDIVEDPIGCRG